MAELDAVPPMMGLSEAVTIAFRMRRKIIWVLLVPPVLAILALLILPPVYRAQADILVKTGREYLPQADGDAAMSAPTSTKQEEINSEMELLTSRPVLEATIQKIGLQNLYPGLVQNPPWFTSVEDAAVKKLGNSLKVEPVKLSNVISVTLDDNEKVKAQNVLNALIEEFIKKHTEVFAEGHSESYAIAINEAIKELSRLEQQRTKIKLDNGIYDIAAQRAALITQRVDAENHLQESINNQETLQKRLAYLDSVRNKIPSLAKTTNIDREDGATHGRELMIDLQRQEAVMATQYAPNYPDLQRIREQIATLKRGISDNGAKTSVSLAPSPFAQQVDQELVMDQAELAPLGDEIARYKALIATLGTELHRLEAADLDLRTASDRADAVSDNLKTMQARYNQARTMDELDKSRLVSVVQVAPAISPDKPAKPKPVLYLAGSIVLGVMIAIGMIVFKIITENRVVNEATIERVLGLPVLTLLPLVERKAGRVPLLEMRRSQSSRG